MKMKYVKPTMIVERFTLTQNIAYTCAPHNADWGWATYADKSSCGWQLPDGFNIAWVEAPMCNDLYGEDEGILGVCYNNPEGGMTIFGS